jgi:hypothetical protein
MLIGKELLAAELAENGIYKIKEAVEVLSYAILSLGKFP